MTQPPATGHNGTVWVDYATFWLIDSGVRPDDLPVWSNGLVGTGEPGTAAIATGIRTGPVTVAAEPRTNPPPAIPLDDWDEVIDITVEAPEGCLEIASPTEGTTEDLPPLTISGPGTYRIRVHARGRDTRRDLTAQEPVEDYLITAWPSQPAPEIVHKTSDRAGASYRLSASRHQTTQ